MVPCGVRRRLSVDAYRGSIYVSNVTSASSVSLATVLGLWQRRRHTSRRLNLHDQGASQTFSSSSNRGSRGSGVFESLLNNAGGSELARTGDNSERGVAQKRFCCLFWGYGSRCLTCPLPKAVLDLFEDGTIDPRKFRKFGDRREWLKHNWSSHSSHSSSHSHSQQRSEMTTSTVNWALAVLGLAGPDKEPPRNRYDLKVAFRNQAKRLHPDIGGNPEQFRELVRAYEVTMALFQPGIGGRKT